MIACAHRNAKPVRIGPDALPGRLATGERPTGLVIVGCHRGRTDPRWARLLDRLRDAGLGTLRVELLHPAEEADPGTALDLALLAARLFSVTAWATEAPETRHLPLGYFAAGLGTAAALLAASGPDRRIRAIVGCGGRVDLAGDSALARVRAPVRLVVGSRDLPGAGLARAVLPRLACETDMAVLPGVGATFAEEGALESVCERAEQWFHRHFAPQPA